MLPTHLFTKHADHEWAVFGIPERKLVRPADLPAPLSGSTANSSVACAVRSEGAKKVSEHGNKLSAPLGHMFERGLGKES